jgi:hypothetical protein
VGRPKGSKNKPKTPRWYIAIDSGVTDVDGIPFNYRRNVTRVKAGDKVLTQAPHSFKPLDDDSPADISRS